MRRFFAMMLALVLLAGLSGCNRLEPEHREPGEYFYMRFLDVGQADAILIGCDDRYMLVDGGNIDNSSTVAAVLKRENITYLDYIVGTHPHEDHMGGLSGALSVAKVGTALAPVKTASGLAFGNFVKYLKKQGKSITVPECDSQFELGSALVTVLGPRRDDYEDVNDTSIILMIQYGDTRFLLTGDAEGDAERDLLDSGIDLSCDLMKIGHHGSRTSTSYEFLNAVMPPQAVISVGKNNLFGHPKTEVLSRLRDADVKLYRTDMQGDILVQSDGTTVTVTPSHSPSAVTNPTRHHGEGQNVIPAAYIGNINSLKFHRLTCGSLPDEENRVYFDSRKAAVDGGYKPCGTCKP